MTTGTRQKSLGRRLRDRVLRRPLRRFRYDLAGRGRSLLVRLDTINRCNMRCWMCPWSAAVQAKPPRQVMAPALFAKIAEQIFPYTYHAALSCAYEPLLHPQLDEILEIASRYDVPEWGVVTNASLLDESVAASMIRHGMKVLSVSLDGVRPETYRDIRGVDGFDTVVANVRRIQAMKREAASEVPHLLMNFVLMRRNLDEVVPFLDLARELGAEDVTFVHVMPRGRENAASLVHEPERYAEVHAEAKRRAERMGMRVLLPAPFGADELAAEDRTGRERRLQRSRASDLTGTGARTSAQAVEDIGDDIYCVSPWMMLFIAPNGDVHPCSHRQNDPPFGNLADEPFEAIWNGRAYLELRRRLYYHDLAGLCRTCEAATPNSEPLVRRPIRVL